MGPENLLRDSSSFRWSSTLRYHQLTVCSFLFTYFITGRSHNHHSGTTSPPLTTSPAQATSTGKSVLDSGLIRLAVLCSTILSFVQNRKHETPSRMRPKIVDNIAKHCVFHASQFLSCSPRGPITDNDRHITSMANTL